MIATTWRGLSADLAARSRTWVFRRQGSDKHQAILNARRIYILPTKAGLLFATVVFILLISSMNFSNNMGFVLSFLLAGIGIVSMHHCQRNLIKVQLQLATTQSGFAGQQVFFHLRLNNLSTSSRWKLRIAWDRNNGSIVNLEKLASADVTLALAAPSRGILAAPRISISTTFPLGLCRAWGWIHLDTVAIVWPQPADVVAEPVSADAEDASNHSREQSGDDLSGMREYRRGDSPRRIDWKGLARHGELNVRQFDEGHSSKTWLDWDALAWLDTEQRLSMLARLALEAEAEGITWGLRLPGISIAPDKGTVHLHKCLDHMALHGVGT